MSLQLHEDHSRLHEITRLATHSSHGAIVRCSERKLHLHRFKRHDDLAFDDALAWNHCHPNYRCRHWRCQRRRVTDASGTRVGCRGWNDVNLAIKEDPCRIAASHCEGHSPLHTVTNQVLPGP